MRPSLTVDVSGDDLRDFIADQASRNSEATALVRFKSLQQFFRHCVEEDELEVSPMAGMRAPKVEPPPVPVVSDAVLRSYSRPGPGPPGDRRDTALAPGLPRHRLPTRRGDRPPARGRSTCGHRPMAVRGKGNRVRVVTFGAKTAKRLGPLPPPARARTPEAIGGERSLWIGRQGRMSTAGSPTPCTACAPTPA